MWLSAKWRSNKIKDSNYNNAVLIINLKSNLFNQLTNGFRAATVLATSVKILVGTRVQFK